MAQFTEDLHNFRPLASFPFLDNSIDPSMELINQFIGMNNTHVNMPPLSCDTFFAPEFQGNLEQSAFQSLVHDANNSYEVPVSSSTIIPDFHQAENSSEIHEGKKRKAITMDLVVPATTSSANSTPASSDNGSRTKNGFGRGKRVKSNVTEDERKPKEVVHVRARRGQATDSHSIAERVRRGKINEKLKCLQNIVPGCYKQTMGMAVMLDEIINYVQSLQNQVEFLSLKLTAASTFYDFNSETDDLETMQRARASNAKELGKYGREGCGGASCYQPL